MTDEETRLKSIYAQLNATDPQARYEAAIALSWPEISGVSFRPQMSERLIPLLDDPHDHVRYYAVVSLGKLGDRLSIPALTARLEKEKHERSPRIGVVRALEDAIRLLTENGK